MTKKSSVFDLIGMTMENAEEACRTGKIEGVSSVRVVRSDSESHAITCELCYGRVNVDVERGRIIKVLGTF